MKRASLLISLILATVFPSAALGQTYYQTYSGISRAEFVRLAMEQTGTFSVDGTNCFNDVRTQSYASYVCAAKQQGIITGDPSGNFRPDAPITFIEAGVIAIRAERINVGVGGTWYQPYLTKLSEYAAIPSGLTSITMPISYQQGVDIISRVMERGGDDNDNDDDDDNDQDSDDDMTLSVTVSDATPNPGDRVTFRIRLENEGNDDVDDIQVVAELDNDMEYISSTDDGSLDDDEVEWEDIEAEEDETKTILLNVEIDNDADDGDVLSLRVTAENGEELRVTKTVRVEDDDDDDDDDDDLRLTITDGDDPVEEGENLTYHIRLENEGDDDIEVDVTAFLDEDTDFVSASHSGDESRDEVDWDEIEVDEDESVTLTLTVRLKSSAEDGDELEIRVEANEEEDTEHTEVEDDDDDDNDDDDENVNITITEVDDPVDVGDTIEYRISIENQENHDITIDVNAFIDDDLVSYLSSSHDGDLEGDDEVIWEDFEIDEDQTRVLTLSVRVKNSADDGDEVELRVEAGDDEDSEQTEIQD